MTEKQNFDEFVFSIARVSKHGIGGFDPATAVVLATTFDNVHGPLSEAPRVCSITLGATAKIILDLLNLVNVQPQLIDAVVRKNRKFFVLTTAIYVLVMKWAGNTCDYVRWQILR